MNRYSAEFADDEELPIYLNKADELYKTPLETANQNLGVSDPIFLGTTLNYSVFLKEHLKLATNAIDLIRDAINNAHQNYKELSDGSTKEASDIIKIMQQNYKSWIAKDEDGEEKEEEDV